MADFKAKLKYLTKEEGGKRTTPTHSGYRPHIKFPFSENLNPGKQIFLDKAVVNPGDEVTAEITIVDHVTFRNVLDCFSFDANTVICKESEIDLYISTNLKGLC